MTTNETLAAIVDEVAGLRARVEAQEAELAALRRPVEPASDPRFGRRHLIGALAGLGVAGAAGLATAQPAAAADGDPLVLGSQANASTAQTRVTHTGSNSSPEVGIAMSTTSWTALGVACEENPDFQPTIGRNALYADVASLTTDGDRAIWARAADGFGVYGDCVSMQFPAVAAENLGGGPGLGGMSSNGGPQLWLDSAPDEPVGPPTTGLRGRGQIKADVNGDLWMCVATGTPGTWTRLLREDTAGGRTVPITPVRVLDTREANGRPAGSPVVPGQVGGVRHGGQLVTLDLSGSAGIPASASGVIGRLTVVSPTGAGHLTVAPAGTSTNTSALDFTARSIAGDAFFCKLATEGITITAPISNKVTYHLIVDVTGYIT